MPIERNRANPRQGRYWILTLAHHTFTPFLPVGVQWIKGQLESGQGTGYLHWQVCLSLPKKGSLQTIKGLFGEAVHAELTRSEAAEAYVFKDDTAIAGTRFELGEKKVKLNSKVDWKRQMDLAKEGKFEDMDAGVLFRNYNTVKRIRADHVIPPPSLDDVCGLWIWGPPGTGKSHMARVEFPKYFDKMINKWWDGYDEYKYDVALLDDFDVVHKPLGHYLKRWADKYPFTGEVKGLSVQLRPRKIVVTSNYSIDEIFGDDVTLSAALRRRFHVIHKTEPWGGIM